MKIHRGDATRTRGKLLTAAVDIFAERGYRDATVAEICMRAGTNVAAVNYHFGNKETLYIEAWRHAFSESVQAHPVHGGVSADAPPEERLRGQITSLLERIADENNREFWFMQREIANPTGLLEEVMREEIRPLQQRTETLVRELLGPHVPDREVRFCEIGIISQCINPMVLRNRLNAKRGSGNGPPGIEDIKAYARHVVTFSLAGLRAIRTETEEGQSQGEAQKSENRSRP